jgi:GDP-4-dehydro-6-deoxy-D-mannose reductase|tara:strand:+ start:2562 stop:3464 length:903 start_codon:yes stop_codon:yes gene_type:complete
MVCLITGAAGMMGSHLYETLLSHGQEVIPTYHKPTIDSRDKILDDITVTLDVLDKSNIRRVLSKYQPSVIYHLAAQSRPDVSFEDPIHTLTTNVIGTSNLLDCCAELNLNPLFINASSSAVYGDIDWSTPPDEDRYCNPLSPYGTSKLSQEHVVRNYHQMYGIDYVNIRIFNCTGPRKTNDFVSDMCKRVVNEEFPIKVGNLNGVRSIIDVRDLTEALYLCQNIKNETINLGSSVSLRISDVFKKIVGDHDYYIDDSLLRPTDEPIIIGNIDKAKNILSWTPKISLEKTISDTLDYWKNL